MATYAVQFLSRDGALWGQTITNHERAAMALSAWTPDSQNYAVSILIVGANFEDRTALGDLAVSDVLFNRRDALSFINRVVQYKEQRK